MMRQMHNQPTFSVFGDMCVFGFEKVLSKNSIRMLNKFLEPANTTLYGC
jgi:hypothetical protein